MSDSLEDLQAWMLRAVSHPDGLAAGVFDAGGLEGRVRGSRKLDPAERLHVYAYMYFARLRDVMKREYPTVAAVLGDDGFDDAVRGYLAACPSRHYSLNRLSDRFPDWLADSGVSQAPFLVDVARVERAMEEVVDHPVEDRIDGEALAAIPPSKWGELHLDVTGTLRPMVLDYRVGQAMTAVQKEQEPTVPGPRTTWLTVFRGGFTVWRQQVPKERFDVLAGLAAGRSLGDAVFEVASADGVDAAALMGNLGAWFEEWTRDRMFVGFRLG